MTISDHGGFIFYLIENDKGRILSLGQDDITVTPSDLANPLEAKNLWKKGVEYADGYCTLENSKIPKIITPVAVPGGVGLEIKGNKTLR